jgi:glycosyltransferase involved in cell wall biosynthesis
MIKSFVYFIPMRLPTTNAHGIQIFQTLSAMTSFASDVKLAFGLRRQTDKDLKGRSPFDFYDVEENFRLRSLPYVDVVWLWGKMPSSIWSFALRAASVIFAVTCWFYMIFFESRRESIAYTREWMVAAVLAVSGYRVGLEVHQVNTTEFSDRAISFISKLSVRRPQLKVIAISKNIRDEFIRYGVSPESIVVAPDGVDLENNSEAIKSHKGVVKDFGHDVFHVGYTGQLHDGKGIDLLIDAAQMAPQLQFHILGGDHLSISRWSQYCDFRNVANVTFHGYLPYSQVNQWQRRMDLLVLPQTSTAFQSPLKLFEYMASGVPFVCADLTVLREVITDGKNCRTFKAGSSRDLLSVIHSVRSNYSESLEHARAAIEEVQQYSWHGRASRIRDAMV